MDPSLIGHGRPSNPMASKWDLLLFPVICPPPPSGMVWCGACCSQPESILWKVCQEELFPDPAVTYSVDSGGDPRHIPDLTFEEFVHFYKTHYHPSNARCACAVHV